MLALLLAAVGLSVGEARDVVASVYTLIPEGAVELQGLRTEYSRTFALPDGKRLVEIAPVPLFRRANGGVWLTVDTDSTDSVFPSIAAWWTGHVRSQNQVGTVKNDNQIYWRGGNSASADKRRGWMKFDLSPVPDDGTVNATGIVYYCDAVDQNGGPNSVITHVTIDPVPATATALWSAIYGGTPCTNPSGHGTGWVLRPLNAAGVAAVVAGRAQDWVCYGIYETGNSDSRWGTALGYFPRATAPRLYVTYTPPPPLPDIGVTAIVAPQGSYDTGSMIIPQYVVHNYHTAPFGYTAYVFLRNPSGTRVWSDLKVVSNQSAGTDTILTFGGYNVGAVSGNWTVRCSVFASVDTHRVNDTLSGTFQVQPRHIDVAPTVLLTPVGSLDTGVTVQPSGIWRNNTPQYPASFKAYFKLRNPSSQIVYTESIAVTGLGAGAETTLVFPSYYFGTQEGNWLARCSTWSPIDTNHSNDVRQEGFVVTRWRVPQDVGVTAISSPVGRYDTGTTIQRAAVWHNYLGGAANFYAYMMLYKPNGALVSTQQMAVNNLPGYADTTIVFAPYTLDTTVGLWTVRCSTFAGGDTTHGNDTRQQTFLVWPEYVDVGVVGITAPVGSVDTNTTLQPAATVRNYATQFSANLKAWLFLENPQGQRVYAESVPVHNLAAGAQRSISFPSYNVGQITGAWVARCSTWCALDSNPTNDLAAQGFMVSAAPLYVDVGVRTITAPTGSWDTGSVVQPTAIWRNYSATRLASFWAWFMLFEPEGEMVYRESLQVSGLEPGIEASLTFPQCNLGSFEGNWLARCSTWAAEDSNRFNDVLQQEFTVTRWTVRRDVGVRRIESPIGIYDTGATVNRIAVWHNFFATPVTFDAVFIIEKPGGLRVSVEQVQVVNLASDADTTIDFGPYVLDTTQGDWTVRCSTGIEYDTCRSNNVLVSNFGVWQGGKGPWPYGWSEVRSVPAERSGKSIKAGGWLEFMPGRRLLFAAKGNNTEDFYSYDPLGDRWTSLAPIPSGTGGRLPKKGAIGCADANRYVYLARGSNTTDFLRYDAVFDTWENLANVPLAPSNKAVKGGGDAVYVEIVDTGYVYLLKGGKCDFYRYNTVTNTWEAMRSAPIGTAAKWDGGSWLAYDGTGTIYAHRSKKHDLWAYDIATDSWTKQLTGMPYMRQIPGRAKKAKDGSSGTWFDGCLYALKGGNTCEFYRYAIDGDSWIGLESMPAIGRSGRKKKVKDGGAIVAYGDSVFFALKGGGTAECWRYRLSAPVYRYIPPTQPRDGSASTGVLEALSLELAPNPIISGRLNLRYNLPLANGELTMVDVLGRVVYRVSLSDRVGVLTVDRRRLRGGAYWARIEAGGLAKTVKLVVR